MRDNYEWLMDRIARQEATAELFKARHGMKPTTRNSTSLNSPSRVEATTDKVDRTPAKVRVYVGFEKDPKTGEVFTVQRPVYSFTVPGPPVPKPRQTQRDKWQKRPCVMRYREWADHARKCAGELPLMPRNLTIVAYFPFPESWSIYKRGQLRGLPHRQRNDADNILKACADALYPKGDEMIHHMSAEKFWDDGRGPRVEITIY